MRVKRVILVAASGLMLAPSIGFGQAFPTWQGSGTNWTTGANWSTGNGSNYGQLQWTGGGNTTSNNDFSSLSQYRLFFNSSVNYNLTGNAVSLFDFGGNSSWVLNQGASTPTIGLTVNFSDNGARRGWVTTQGSGGLSMSAIGMFNSVTGLNFASNNTSGVITVSGVISGSSSGQSINIGRNESNITVDNTRVVFSGANTYSGATNIDAGTLAIGAGGTSGTLNSASAISLGSGSLSNVTLSLNRSDSPTFSNAVTLASGANRFVEVPGSNTATLSGVITSSAAEFWKSGTGTLVLSNSSNNLAGSKVIDAGTLEVTTPAALGGSGMLFLRGAGGAPRFRYSGASSASTDRLGANALQFSGTGNTIDISDALGTLDVTSNIGGFTTGMQGGSAVSGLSKTGSGTLVLSGTNTYSGGTEFAAGILRVNSTGALGTTGNLRFLGGTLQHSANNTVDYSGRIANTTSSIRIDTNGQSVTYASNFGFAHTGGLTKLGAGTLTLSGSNDYSGGTVINAGTVVVNSNTSLGSTGGSVSFTGNGTVQLAASFDTARNISVNASTGTIDTNGFNQTHSGVISSDGNLIKAGAGTLTLTNTSTFSGTTSVTAGSLIVNGTLNTQTSAVSVSGGATIGGSGSIDRPVSLGSTAILAPGSASGDKSLSVRSLSLANDSALNFDLSPTNTTIDGSVNDVVSVSLSGGLTLDGVLNVTTLGGAFTGVSSGTTWRLFNYAGSLTNNTLSLGTMPGLSSGLSWSIDTATAGQVNLTVVPEPAVIAGMGLISLATLKRRRVGL